MSTSPERKLLSVVIEVPTEDYSDHDVICIASSTTKRTRSALWLPLPSSAKGGGSTKRKDDKTEPESLIARQRFVYW